jgi:ferredoxin thioredoxin reductase catalytic beta chain|nr:MAG TPA: ferredoxin-thioredoxin reductase [Caudoviricetes sp.]
MIILMNPDTDFVKQFKKQLKKNNNYCLCKIKKTPETKCMCKEFIESQEEGYCECGLYYKIQN